MDQISRDDIIDLYYYEEPDGASERHRAAVAYVGTSQCVQLEGTDLGPWVGELARHIASNCPPHGDFRFEHEGTHWRGVKDHSNGTTNVALRRLPQHAPQLEALAIARPVRTILLHPWLNDGGLVLFAGLTGQGKTTTASATLCSRLQHFGGRAVAVEDVSEIPMEGTWGGGTCRQIAVDYFSAREHDRGFAGAVRRAYRSMPATRPAILYIGEVRDTETAAEVVKAASNGMLVITTVHAGDPAGAILRVVSLAEQSMGDTAAVSVAQSLRLVVHQSLSFVRSSEGWSRGTYEAIVLASDGASHPVANHIRKGTFPNMREVWTQQNIRIKNCRAEPADGVLHALLGNK